MRPALAKLPIFVVAGLFLLCGLAALWLAAIGSVWSVLALMVILPRLVLDTLIVLTGIIGAALILPMSEAAWNAVPALHPYWPLMLAAAVPVPLALMADRIFFRR
ncbi:hypothetical protein [Hyphomonas sp.]|uniref:hypothetical protein n=1 Tax=Hyphomonas sp. TaxID=87 RepID=UPI0025BC46D8|nr:hypothetical protein [Hyphomonas sp.]MBI1399894.1 hypothetical protein [Hyphomonas sp.]